MPRRQGYRFDVSFTDLVCSLKLKLDVTGACLCPLRCWNRFRISSTGTTWIDQISLLRKLFFDRHENLGFQVYPSRLNDSDDPFLRMLAVLRFTFTKDLKFVVRVVGYFYIGTVSMVVCRSMERSSSPTILSLENISGPTGTSFPVFMFLMTPINLKRH